VPRAGSVCLNSCEHLLAFVFAADRKEPADDHKRLVDKDNKLAHSAHFFLNQNSLIPLNLGPPQN
jgi:hypothetical protein